MTYVIAILLAFTVGMLIGASKWLRRVGKNIDSYLDEKGWL
jgi:ABC-type nitrate/sulfonate/bicarbonate transport system permease component